MIICASSSQRQHEPLSVNFRITEEEFVKEWTIICFWDEAEKKTAAEKSKVSLSETDTRSSKTQRALPGPTSAASTIGKSIV